MDVTGERYLPELDWPEISYEHWHRYLWAAQLVTGRHVLDVGCGEGYGSSVLAAHAREVLGVDTDEAVIAQAIAKYQQPNLRFLHGSAERLPVNEHDTFDAVVGFEMIEHLTAEGQQAFLAEVRRVLQPEGLFIVSTPDKRLYSDATNYVNAFHLHELYVDEFATLLGGSFGHVYLLGQRVFPTSHIWPLDQVAAGLEELQLHYTDGHFVPGSDDQKQAIFVIAVCSDVPLAPERLSLLVDTSGQVTFRTQHALTEQEQLIAKQRADVLELQGMVAARDEQLAKDADDIAQLQGLVAAREAQLAKDADDIAQLQGLVAAREAQLAKDADDIAQLQGLVTAHEAQLTKDADDISVLQSIIVEREAQLVKDAHDIAMLQGMVVVLDAQIAKDVHDVELLQNLLIERNTRLAKNVDDIAALQGMVVERDAQLAKDARDIMALLIELEQFKTSRGGRALMAAWRLRQRVLPSGGVAARGGRLMFRTMRMLGREGPQATLRHSVGWLRNRQGVLPIAQPTKVAPVAATISEQFDAYNKWLDAHRPSAEELQRQREQLLGLVESPLVSLVLLLDGATPPAVRATLASLRDQTYSRWECWLVTSVVAPSVLRDAIAPVVHGDERVRILSVSEKAAAAQINVVLKQLDGQFVAFLDTGDLLAFNALFATVTRLQDHPALDVIYSDNDHLNVSGHHVAPLFKPDWSPTLVLSLNYLSGLTLLRTARVRELGGADHASGIAWLWDIVLRLSERTNAIAHVPQVLSHRVGGAASAEAVTPDGQAAVLRHLARQGSEAEVVPHPRVLQIRWSLPAEPLVSIIIPSRNAHMLDRCLRSIHACTSYRNFECIVIDTSVDGAIAAQYEADSDLQPVVLPSTEPFNYSLVNNLAARKARGEMLLFLNDDIEAFEPDWLRELVSWALHDDVGVVGAQLLRADGSLQHAGVVIGLQGFAGHPFDGGPATGETIFGSPEWYRNYSAVTGACLLIKRDLFDQIGGFDEEMILCGSDVELCLRARERGYQVVYTPFARLYHLESATRGGSAIPSMDFAHSYVCYLPLLEGGDPFFNPNLSVWSPQPKLRARTERAALDHVRASLRQLGISDQLIKLLQERRHVVDQ